MILIHTPIMMMRHLMMTERHFRQSGISGHTGSDQCGCQLKSCETTLALTEQYPFIYGAIGVHPSETAELDACGMDRMKAWCASEKIRAVGEIGLDYYWEEPEHEIQKKWFAAQLDLAKELKLPVIIHSRDAAKDTLDIMKAEHAEELGGVIHCFSYTKEMAREYLNMGFSLGIGGVLTFKMPENWQRR